MSYLLLVVPNRTTPIFFQLCIATREFSFAGAALEAIPHLLFVRTHERNSQPHPLGTPNPSNSVNVVFFLVW